jgi:hypothetical protein
VDEENEKKPGPLRKRFLRKSLSTGVTKTLKKGVKPIENIIAICFENQYLR